MGTDQTIQRINELAKKEKTTGLTASEKKEQEKLRKKYLTSFRKSFKKQITSIRVVDPKGKDVTPDKIKKSRKNKK